VKASGSVRSRTPTGPSWRPASDHLRPGDTPVVPSPDRLYRSLADLIGRPRPRRARGLLERPGPGVDRLFGPARRLGAGNLPRPGGQSTSCNRSSTGSTPRSASTPGMTHGSPSSSPCPPSARSPRWSCSPRPAYTPVRLGASWRPGQGSPRWCAAVIVWSVRAQINRGQSGRGGCCARPSPPTPVQPTTRRTLVSRSRSSATACRPQARSSSPVPAGAVHRALQLDPARRGGTNRQRRGKATTTVPPHPAARKGHRVNSVRPSYVNGPQLGR
jgi:hypothetical protein